MIIRCESPPTTTDDTTQDVVACSDFRNSMPPLVEGLQVDFSVFHDYVIVSFIMGFISSCIGN